MLKYVLRTGFSSYAPGEYAGEHIYKVIDTKEDAGFVNYLLDVNHWIKKTGPDQYLTEFNAEERWAAVDAVETDDDTGEVLSKTEVGFIILKNNARRQTRRMTLDVTLTDSLEE
jgi:hypothetical protein